MEIQSSGEWQFKFWAKGEYTLTGKFVITKSSSKLENSA